MKGSNSGLGTATRASRNGADLSAVELASRLRQLALDAHRVMKNPFATTSELVELSRQIDELRGLTGASPVREIDRWLQCAAEQIRELRTELPAGQSVR
jgi:hypothetical protein